MTKLEKLQKELIAINGNDKYLFNTSDIMQCKTFATNIVLSTKMYKKETHYDISQNEILSIRVDSNKVKFAVTRFIITETGNSVTVKTFMLVPKKYKKELYREQIITHLIENNDNFIGDIKTV